MPVTCSSPSIFSLFDAIWWVEDWFLQEIQTKTRPEAGFFVPGKTRADSNKLAALTAAARG